MSSNGRSLEDVDSTELTDRQLLEAILDGLVEAAEERAEILEKLSNLSLDGPGFSFEDN